MKALYKALFIISAACLSQHLSAQLDSSAYISAMGMAAQSWQAKDYPKCREYALQAIAADSTKGAPHILIGSAYAASAKDCAQNSFEEGMTYCLAVDQFIKAKEVDSTIHAKADKLIEVYSKYFPSREYCVWGVYEGGPYFIDCWIQQETTLRYSH